jgi:hypothetical protein
VAVQPWELELADPASSKLVDSVVSVRADHGRRLVRLTRFTVQTGSLNGTGLALAEGGQVGLRVAPGNVRLLPDDPSV